MQAPLTTTVLRSIDEIGQIRNSWHSWQWHPNSDIDYYLSLFQFRPELGRPHIIVVTRNGHAETILIGRFEQKRIKDFKIGPWRIFKPYGRVLSFIYAGLLGNETLENCEAVVQEIVKSLRTGEADMATIVNLRIDSPLYAAANNGRGFPSQNYFNSIYDHFSMKLPTNIDEVYKGLSGHHRHKVRNQAKRFLAAYPGQIRIENFHKPDGLDRLMQDVEYVARKTYQWSLGVGFMNTPEIRYRLKTSSEKGLLRASVLYVGDLPCTFWIGTLYCGVYHVDWIGFDPAYGEHSPGTFLFMKMLEGFCAEGVKEVDFGYGSEGYKQRFGNSTWQEGLIYLFASDLKGLKLKTLRMQAFLTDKYLRQGLERSKLLPQIKRAWRKHLIRGSAESSGKRER